MDLADELWPSIAESNKGCQKQGQNTRNMLAILQPGSFIRAPKGTVVRQSSLKKHDSILEKLYAGEGGDAQQNGPILALPYSLQNSMLDFVRKCTEQTSYIAGNIGDRDDFYVHGLDSIQTIQLVRMLAVGLRPQYGDLVLLTSQTVFEHPTIEALATALAKQLTASDVNSLSETATTTMDSMVSRYSERLKKRQGGAV